MGMKGCGEAGTVGAMAAVANAVLDALWEAGRARGADAVHAGTGLADAGGGAMSEVEVIDLTAETAGLLDHLAPDVFDEPILPKSLVAFLEDPRHLLVLAVVDGVVIGKASGTELFHPDKPPQLFINEVDVTPERQRQGIGRALVSALVTRARARGCSYAWLGTAVDNAGGNACFGSVPGVARAEEFVLYEWELD